MRALNPFNVFGMFDWVFLIHFILMLLNWATSTRCAAKRHIDITFEIEFRLISL